MKFLKTVLMVIGGLLALAGGVFFLQGINVITVRSFMRDDPHWSLYGGIMFVAGIGLLVLASQKHKGNK